MGQRRNDNPINKFPKSLSNSIKGEQSVRTTFRLSTETNEAIAWLAKFHGVTQKKVIDICVNELHEKYFIKASILPEEYQMDEDIPYMYIASAKAEKRLETKPDSTIRKSQVVSRKSLEILNSFSKEQGVSRDRLVEAAIDLLKELNEKERKDLEKGLEEIDKFIDDLEERKERLKETLDSDNPAIRLFITLINEAGDFWGQLQDHIYKGTPFNWW